MDASSDLTKVLEKLKKYWLPQVDATDQEIELTDVNQRSIMLETPIMVAAYWLNPEDIQVLVDNGAEIDAQCPCESDQTALHYAAMHHRPENVKKLIELGASQKMKLRSESGP
jgi:ankyrin repeat protein